MLSPAPQRCVCLCWVGEQPTKSDAGLVARLRAGDVAAFDQVYEWYRPRLFSFLTRLSGQSAVAEELVQETFLRLARHAPRLEPTTRLAAWLFTVARNLHSSQRRWALLDIGRLAELRIWAKLSGPAPCPFAHASAGETERQLELGLAALPLDQREVLLLVAQEGMTPSEAAWVVGIEPSAARQRLSRARAMLREHLKRAARRSEP